MYRHAASLNMAAIHSLPSPAPDELSDCDTQVLAELQRKRRQIDEEITRFKAQKEKEFRDFEKGLRWNRKRSRSPVAKDTPPAKSPSTLAPSALSLLAAGSKPQVNGNAHKKRSSDGLVSPKSKPPASKPTLSLDKLTINGTTTPPAPGSPAGNASALTKSLSRSPSNMNIALTPPRGRASFKTPTTPHDRNDTSFAGLFTPAYLPLLDSRPRDDPKPAERAKGDTPLPPKSDSVLPLSADLSRIPEPVPISTSLPHENSPSLLSTHSRRALTAPALPSTSLPSALRTASGTAMRKRKKVTFRLSDSAIVEPSSSYEELPTPDLNYEGTTGAAERNGIAEIIEEDMQQYPFETDASSTPGAATGTTDPVQNGFVPVQLTLPNQRKSSPDADPTSPTSPTAFIDSLHEAEDGGSGVGFFELDEELESPGIGEANPYSHVGDVDGDVDDLLEEPDGDGAGSPKKTGKKGKRGARHGEGEGELKHGSFTAGSVPIDIVNRGTAWFGSYGH